MLVFMMKCFGEHLFCNRRHNFINVWCNLLMRISAEKYLLNIAICWTALRSTVLKDEVSRVHSKRCAPQKCVILLPMHFFCLRLFLMARHGPFLYTYPECFGFWGLFFIKIINESSFSGVLIACFYGITSSERLRLNGEKTNRFGEMSVSNILTEPVSWIGEVPEGPI